MDGCGPSMYVYVWHGTECFVVAGVRMMAQLKTWRSDLDRAGGIDISDPICSRMPCNALFSSM